MTSALYLAALKFYTYSLYTNQNFLEYSYISFTTIKIFGNDGPGLKNSWFLQNGPGICFSET